MEGDERLWLFPRRARVRGLVLRALGIVSLVAFLSLAPQVPVLIGPRGLEPSRDLVPMLEGVSFLDAPVVFPATSEGGLDAVLALGAVASAALALGLVPRLALVAIWATYSSLAFLCQDFLGFQWDNLLLESALFAWLVAGWEVRVRPREPHPVAALLFLFLAFRLHFESGVAKLAGGDPTWRDLTAMASYYETAPIPTALGWWAHQLPMWAHEASTLAVLFLELVVPFGLFAGHRVRGATVAILAAMHAGIFLTANYGFFNPLSIVLCAFALDDDHLAWIAERFGRKLELVDGARAPERAELAAARIAGGAALAGLSLVPFLPFTPIGTRPIPLVRVLHATRTLNAYHLFVHMTIDRKEVVIEGSDDGERWESYEFRWKPGDVDRAPPFVAPHQPRVDFLCWFLTLGRERADWFQRLARATQEDPDSVAELFSRNPFPRGPRFLRISIWRYRFTDLETGRRTGAWWTRELEKSSNVVEKR